MKEELEIIKEYIDKNDTISFDVFDTLLLRNVLKPTDVFKALEKKAKEEFQIENFSEERIKAEEKSRIGNENNETTLDRIYSILEKKFGKKLTDLKQMELEAEEKFLIPNPFIYQVYKYAKEKGKEIIVISDMYLPKEFVKKILKKSGYDILNIYVSSEDFKVKWNKTLFEKVKEIHHLNIEKWLHIGDNKISDYEIPKSMGINAYLYKAVGKRSGYQNKTGLLEESIIKGIEQNMIFTKDCTDWEKFGIECVSPIYYGFTNWIYQMTKKQDNIYFLARDGYIIKPIYEKFLKKLKKNIDTYYLYCSRATYQLPTLVDTEKSLALNILTRYNVQLNQKLKMKSILETIGLDEKKYDKAFRNFELTPETIVTPKNVNQIKKFLSYIYDDIIIKLNEKKKIVQEYIDSMNFKKYDNINIVDIGWAGSTQYSLYKLCDKKITGYYFGTRKSMYDDVKYNSFGFLFDGEEPENYFKFVDKYVMMFEFIFSAPHGSTIGFEKKGKEIFPILENNDSNKEIIECFQKCAVEACEQYLKYYDELKELNKDVMLNNYKTFLIERKYEHLKMFEKVTEAVGFDGARLSFVPTLKESDIRNNLNEFSKKTDSAMWRNTFLVEGMNQKEYEAFIKELNSKKFQLKYIVKNMNVKTIYQTFRYPRTSIRRIKNFLKRKEDL